jgi:hypothetical protein
VNYAIQFDPYEVLGVGPQANLAEIQEAYRARSKRYHPDAGGDAWAFRVLTRSYEILSTARVMGRASQEEERQDARVRAAAHPATESPRASAASEPGERTRAGVHDDRVPPERQVQVEMLILRYQLDDPMKLFGLSPEERNLSCTLQIAWPPPGVDLPADPRPILKGLNRAYKAATKAARPNDSRSEEADGRFAAWLSYGTAVKADHAFHAFKTTLNEWSMGVVETIRELTIPREWNTD